MQIETRETKSKIQRIFEEKEKERLAKWRKNLKKDPDRYGKFKEDDKLRKWAAKKRKEVPEAANSEVPEAGNSEGYTQENAQRPGSSFSCKQTLHRSLSRADSHLPKSPHKKAEIIQRLATKCKLRINLKEKRGRPCKELTEREKIWLVEFLDRSDISYTNPGRKESVYIGKINEERQYMQKKYLLWPLREIVSIANSQEAVDESFESKFDKILTFSLLYDFLKVTKSMYIALTYNMHLAYARFVKILHYLQKI